MPIDYKKYPANWKTVIRPAILTRAFNHCELCNVKNGIWIIRGFWHGREAYQDEDGMIYCANTSERLGGDYVGEVGDGLMIRIVLTIMHLDHNIENNDYSNLKAGCQRCHNRYDRENRNINRKANKLAKQPQLFE